jgi:hypothetical protein
VSPRLRHHQERGAGASPIVGRDGVFLSM